MSNAMERINHHSHVTERLMFLPTGEVFKDEQNSSYYHSDFLFSGKELDAETGNYYFGARYLAPRLGIWLSPDPMQLKYPHVSSYAYCMGNLVKLTDLFGLAPGDFFRTVNAAAVDFGLFYNYNSISASSKEMVDDIEKVQTISKIYISIKIFEYFFELINNFP